MKNQKQTSNLNFKVQLFEKSENHLFWCFLSKVQCRNENQNYISNFIFQFIKKRKRSGTLGTRINVPLTYSINLLSEITLLNTCSVILKDIAAEIHNIFIDAQRQYHIINAQRQYHTKIYYTISGFLVWAASLLLWTKHGIPSSV